MDPQPSPLYQRCAELFQTLLALTGGDHGSSWGYGQTVRHIFVRSTVSPSEGRSVMQETLTNSPYGRGYVLNVVPGKTGCIIVPLQGETLYYEDTNPADIELFLAYWAQFAADLDAFLKERNL